MALSPDDMGACWKQPTDVQQTIREASAECGEHALWNAVFKRTPAATSLEAPEAAAATAGWRAKRRRHGNIEGRAALGAACLQRKQSRRRLQRPSL